MSPSTAGVMHPTTVGCSGNVHVYFSVGGAEPSEGTPCQCGQTPYKKTMTEAVAEVEAKERREFVENVGALVEAVQGVFDAEGLDSEHRRNARTALKKAFVPFVPFAGKEKKE